MTKTNKTSNAKGLLALSPVLLFVALYLGVSITLNDFYKIPLTVAFLISVVYALTIYRGHSVKERIDVFCKGAGATNTMLMILIFILAGAFANAAKEMGSIDATVALAFHSLPANMLLAGLFLASCFISLSIGTSVGTTVALVPIAAGIAATTDANTFMVVGAVVGGAFFGDNLSFISDTTVVATQTQGCKMKDKFKVNFFIALPAAIFIFILYVFLGSDMSTPKNLPQVDVLKIIPYIIVLITALCGMNVIIVLSIGAALTGVIGIAEGSYDIFGWFASMGAGILDMGELIIITMLAGGLLEIVKAAGGIDYIIEKMVAVVRGKRGAEFSIGLLVSAVDVCTANNTVAIMTVGGIAKDMSDRYNIDRRKTASLLDTFSCVVQGLLPYGAQLLMAAGLAGISSVSIIPYMYYPFALGFSAICSIIMRLPRRYS